MNWFRATIKGGSCNTILLVISTSLHLLLLINLPAVNVNAFPTGAGGCIGNDAAVGGAHLEDNREVRTFIGDRLSESHLSTARQSNL